MQTKNFTKKTKLGYLKAPIRVLTKIRDFYVRHLSECSALIGYGTAVGCTTAPITILPKSFSVNSSLSSKDEEMSELIKAVSRKSSVGGKFDFPVTGVSVVARSQSVGGIGRIDEDSPCEFGEDVKVNTKVCRRSRSYAVSRRARVF